MARYIPHDYSQHAMVVINYEEQLQPGTFEHAIHYLIDNKVDLSGFDDYYKNDETGRRAYNPALLLKIILFAYSKGITSSREIEWCCQTNIIFKALSCDTVPHFTTIAAFISGRCDEMTQLFEHVLLVCHEQGLLGNELFAIDGCKLPSNAAKEWSGTFKELSEKREKLKRQIAAKIKAHQEADEAEDNERCERFSQTIDTLNNAHDKIDEFLQTEAPRQGKGRDKKEVKSNITDNESAKMTTSKGTIQGYNGVGVADAYCQVVIGAEAFGEGSEYHTLEPIIQGIKERFDRLGVSKDVFADGAIITADTGFCSEETTKYLHDEGIDGYIPDNKFRERDPKFAGQKEKYGKRHQDKTKNKGVFFSASDFSFDPVTKTCLCPAEQNLTLKKEGLDKGGNVKVFFQGKMSQCRECSLIKKCMRNPKAAFKPKVGHGRQVSFLLQGNGHFVKWMQERIDTEEGREIYSHRMSVIEPVFANICVHKGLNRFSLRGKKKVNAQWQLFCTVHNIGKIMSYGNIGV